MKIFLWDDFALKRPFSGCFDRSPLTGLQVRGYVFRLS